MEQGLIKKETLTAIGNSIREKNGTQDAYTPAEMPAAIRAIEGGGGGDNSLLLSIVDRTITDLNSDLFTTVGHDAFMYCSSLTTVSLPNVTSVGDSAFQSCWALTDISLPKATVVEDQAFYDCSALTTISLPNVTSAGRNAFSSCSALTTISLPKVTSVDWYAFNYSDALTKLELSGPTVCKAEGDPTISSRCKIYVPANLIDQYKTAPNWSRYASQFRSIR